jgi:hypothetical protein
MRVRASVYNSRFSWEVRITMGWLFVHACWLKGWMGAPWASASRGPGYGTLYLGRFSVGYGVIPKWAR